MTGPLDATAIRHQLEELAATWRSSGSRLSAAEALAALADPVEQAQQAATTLEREGEAVRALEVYESIADAYKAALDQTIQEQRKDIEPIASFWQLVVRTKHDVLEEPEGRHRVDSQISKRGPSQADIAAIGTIDEAAFTRAARKRPADLGKRKSAAFSDPGRRRGVPRRTSGLRPDDFDKSRRDRRRED